ncbi:carboxymuconolactone decarboxylase family protein [Actibacterium sp. XHP0104]|uniref:carboxymuconolactone decarboxylase family protein n=1 Tax=Actibacterium sp. XHP0104 TaxID=2984335 RepID=UPI0021E813E6|nr:carboxymuconolactone decarboxylase family protein [Actibacterium sp. XHP0104]MCV2882241.1 carboxymuconolactone decarboxylase family protein [Actibacterium sp. XHP0104]
MSWTDKSAETKNQLRALNKCIPEATKGFQILSKGVKEGGVLSFKEKEYVALGIAVATRCDACIVLHVEALIRAGATREEVGDVLAMTIQMGGGPAMMYAAKALEIFDEFSAA